MKEIKKRIVIIGATSSIAEHCARDWVKDTVELILIGRNLAKLEDIAADLRVRNPQSAIKTMTTHFSDPIAIQSLVDGIFAEGPVDIVLIAHGCLPEQTICQEDLSICQDALQINAISPVLFAEAFVKPMQKANHGSLAIIGSVAGDRGRKSNYVYGAAKGLIMNYVQGMQHRLANTAVKVVLIKPGPTETPMTASLQLPKSQLAKVDEVADLIVKGIQQGKTVVYAPKKWRIIMFVVKNLPNFIFNKINI